MTRLAFPLGQFRFCFSNIILDPLEIGTSPVGGTGVFIAPCAYQALLALFEKADSGFERRDFVGQVEHCIFRLLAHRWGNLTPPRVGFPA